MIIEAIRKVVFPRQARSRPFVFGLDAANAA
jgi:hypothetical protein